MTGTIENLLMGLFLSLLTSSLAAVAGVAGDSITAPARKVVDANSQFGFHLFSNLIERDGKKNVFISPASISTALAMTYNGADGTTQETMARTLGLENLTIQEVNTSYASLLSKLNGSDSLIRLSIANSLWANKNTTFEPDFLERTERYYQATVENLDFADPSTPSRINAWVHEKTHGKISRIVDRIKENAILFLINAIYFKGNWSTKFDEKLTQDKDFHLLDGTVKKSRMMFQAGRFQYLRGQNFQAVNLPYGSGAISLYVFLPDSNIGLKRFYDVSLRYRKWEGWMSEFHSMGGSVRLPKFKLENDFILNNALQSLGMQDAFNDSRADFSRMCRLDKPQRAYIDEVRHKTFVEVNEEGSEAAAVTSVGIGITSAASAPEARFEMNVDRPFFFAIRDNNTGMLLFLGSVVRP